MNSQSDKRNLVDRFKGRSEAAIIAELDADDHGLHIAVENNLRDFNMGTIVRNANAFGVRHVHVIGRRQWNRRGAMKTEAYLHLHYHATVGKFLAAMGRDERTVVAVDNVAASSDLQTADLPRRVVLVFGQEGPGLSDELLAGADMIVAIEQFGSTRSVNVGVASGIVVYEWVRRWVIGEGR